MNETTNEQEVLLLRRKLDLLLRTGKLLMEARQTLTELKET